MAYGRPIVRPTPPSAPFTDGWTDHGLRDDLRISVLSQSQHPRLYDGEPHEITRGRGRSEPTTLSVKATHCLREPPVCDIDL